MKPARKPALCEWCRDRPPVHLVELTEGRKVSYGWKESVAIHVCAKCHRVIERNREAKAT